MLNMLDMQSWTGRRKGAVHLGRRKDKQLGVKKTLKWNNRKQVTTGGVMAMTESDIALAAILEAGIT
jgi:hypothetical protein